MARTFVDVGLYVLQTPLQKVFRRGLEVDDDVALGGVPLRIIVRTPASGDPTPGISVLVDPSALAECESV